jgi:hypothetical protein
MLPVTATYAAILAFYFIWLATRVIKARGEHRVPLGTPHRMVERAARAHGNFSEYVPFALLLLALCEANGLPVWALHALGLALIAGRVLHATGIAREPENMRRRVAGMALTFAMIGVAAASLLGLAAASL